jgi:hypothetical protein
MRHDSRILNGGWVVASAYADGTCSSVNGLQQAIGEGDHDQRHVEDSYKLLRRVEPRAEARPAAPQRQDPAYTPPGHHLAASPETGDPTRRERLLLTRA